MFLTSQFTRKPLASLAVFAAATLQPASAFTGQEFTEEFSHEERIYYAAGMADIAAYQQALIGNTDRADCIVEWFYGDDKGVATMRRIQQAAANFPEQHVERVVSALMIRACGDPRDD